MNDLSWLSRTSLLIGEERVRLLNKKHVLIVGMGGVGSFAAEFIARSGIGKMTIIDGDVVDTTNRNRQLPALATNIGQSKAVIMDQRLREINPEIDLTTIANFIEPDKVEDCLTTQPDFIIDAIDSITPKVRFLVQSFGRNIPLVSSMGAGAKLDPTQLRVADISKTYNCPFAQQIRKNLKAHGIFKGITTVFSPEEIIKESLMHTDGKNYKKSAYGTISYLPATFGAVAASVAIRHLIGEKIN
ncbi:MAG: tRNA threonylcarbamoyladenosine dehydratase [Bacteroidetes bacterium]|nr:tRNA threonylcarbamoyladenosine dehydratase [Bacteroidota bacterium]MBS1739242.1 tRNA threonylcarbamoyladenosine dehydratase [Bacteroidota bacterium]